MQDKNKIDWLSIKTILFGLELITNLWGCEYEIVLKLYKFNIVLILEGIIQLILLKLPVTNRFLYKPNCLSVILLIIKENKSLI